MNIQQLTDELNNLHYNNSPSFKVIQSKQKELLEIIKPNTNITKIDNKVVNNYIKALRDRNNTDSTINSKLSMLSALMTYAAKVGYIQSKPYIPFFKVESSKDRFITPAEEVQMLQYCKDNELIELGYIIQIGLNTGLRINEILSLTPESIDNNYIRVWRNKTNKPNSIPMNDKMIHLFTGVLEKININKQDFLCNLNYAQVQYQFDKMVARLGLTDITLHTLRHTFCSRLVQKDIPLTTIQKLANHKNYNTTLRYAHLSNKNLEDAVNCL